MWPSVLNHFTKRTINQDRVTNIKKKQKTEKREKRNKIEGEMQCPDRTWLGSVWFHFVRPTSVTSMKAPRLTELIVSGVRGRLFNCACPLTPVQHWPYFHIIIMGVLQLHPLTLLLDVWHGFSILISDLAYAEQFNPSSWFQFFPSYYPFSLTHSQL